MREFKSLFYLFLLTSLSNKLITKGEAKEYLETLVDIKMDLPQNKDLPLYLKSLDSILNYCLVYEIHKKADVNINFAIFLVDVNLQVIRENKRLELPVGLEIYINQLMEKTKTILNSLTNSSVLIFCNATSWVNTIANMESSIRYEPEMNTARTSWGEFLENINKFERPSPLTSDACIDSILKTPTNNSSSVTKCGEIPDICYDILANGTDYGYPLTHRLLWLIVAKFNQKCSIFNHQLDDLIAQKLCSIMYREAELIVENYHRNTVLIDLLMEQMCLCALNGNLEFLHRSWLAMIILRFQSPVGCFSLSPTDIPRSRNSYKFTEHLDVDICNLHFTSVALSTVAIASRFVIEMYY